MATRHGTRRGDNDGCRCDDGKAAQRRYQQRYRERRASATAQLRPDFLADLSTSERGPGPVEAGVEAEISGLAAEARPGLAQAALALARILDNPKAVNQQPAAAKVLVSMLGKLRSASPAGRRGLAVVRQMTKT